MKKEIFEKKLIAFDLANNHLGDVSKGLKIIDEIASVCKKYPIFNYSIKFQYRDIDSFIHPNYKDDFSFKYVKRFTETRLSDEDFIKMKERIESYGFFTMCTPFDEKSVDKIEQQNFDIVKIASCSINDWPLLERVSETELPIILSIGDRSFEELDKIYEYLKHRDKEFAFLHCVAEYPVKKEHLELNQIDILKNRYPDIKIGFSSHEAPQIRNTDSIKIVLGKGIDIFECHIDTDCLTKNKYSRTKRDIEYLLRDAEETLIVCGEKDKRRKVTEDESKALFGLRRGVFAKRDLNKGDKITNEDIYFAIPLLENSLSANDMSKYIDYTLIEEIKKDEAIVKDKVAIINKETQIRNIYEEVKNFLIKSSVAIPEKFKMEISHHFGIDSFHRFGTAIVTLFNLEYAKKLLVILPKQHHPEHKHILKTETFDVLYGELDLFIDENTIHLNTGDHYTIEKEKFHAFSSEKGCILEEISTTQYPGDSVYSNKKINKNKDRKTLVIFSK